MGNQFYPKSKNITLGFLLVFVLIVGIFSMPREEYIADPMAIRCETVSLINNSSLVIPPSLAESFGERGQFFVENVEKGKWYCKYGILNSLLYLPVLSFQKWCEGTLEYFSPTRVIYLNFFNLFLTIASALYLFLITTRYTKSFGVALFFLIAALYTTYWWNYLRAHNSEIYQTLFMLGFYYHLVSSGDDKRPRRQELFAGLFFGFLILTKVVYVILLPVIGIFLIVRNKIFSQKNFSFSQRIKALFSTFCFFGIPVALALVLIFCINDYKFGAPLESGYGQWQERGQPIFSGDLFSGLTHFFFDPQYSIFIYFPLLTFALFGYPRFCKKFCHETVFFISLGCVILLVNAKLLAWCGGWGYGPRYLLVVLPLVSLPFLEVLQWVVEQRKNSKAIIVGGVIAFVLLISLKMQMNVNALPFFVNFRLQSGLTSLQNASINNYFSKVPFGIINGELLAFKNGVSLPVLAAIEKKLSPEGVEELHQFIRSQLFSNYFWFQDPKVGRKP